MVPESESKPTRHINLAAKQTGKPTAGNPQQFPELVNRPAALDRHARTVFLENEGEKVLGVSY
jgi:hypothetical protein